MKKTVLVVMVVLLAAMVAVPVMARSQIIYDRNGNAIAASEDGFDSMRDRYDNMLTPYEYANGRPDSNDCGRGNGGGYRNDNYGYSSGRRGNGNRTSFSVGVGARIGGVGVSLGYSKTTYSKPKTSSQKPPVIIVNPPVVTTPKPTPTTEKCRMTLVQEVGDQLETISDIIVTNPEKELVSGKRIVFNRAGEFFAEYVVDKVSGDSVFVETVDAPRGNPRQGDSFKIDPEPEDINTVD